VAVDAAILQKKCYSEFVNTCFDPTLRGHGLEEALSLVWVVSNTAAQIGIQTME
jgi:hypothetical protein